MRNRVAYPWRYVAVVLLVAIAGCTGASPNDASAPSFAPASPETFEVSFDTDVTATVIDQTGLVIDALPFDFGAGSWTPEFDGPSRLATIQAPNELLVAWLAGECEKTPALVISGDESAVAIDKYSGAIGDVSQCADADVQRGVVLVMRNDEVGLGRQSVYEGDPR